MKQVLSQQEIDSLLDALHSGEIDTEELNIDPEDNVKSYDFRRPIKLSKEYMNSLYMIFENFSKIAGNFLSSQIQTNVEIELGAVEQISYDEFIRSIPKTTLLGIFNSKPLTGMQILEINPQFSMQVVELVCGGAESSESLASKSLVSRKKGFTDIELGILEDTVNLLLKAFETAWKDVVDIETKLDSMETNPQLVQSISPNEPVVLISFVVDVLKTKSFMNICIPFVSIEAIMDNLSFRSWFDMEKEPEHGDKSLLEEKIKSSDVGVKVELGKSSVSIRDFLGLEEGDIVQLDTNVSSPLKMYVENQLHYLVKPGKFRGKYMVEILEYIEEDVD